MKALLLVDIQNDFLPGGALPVPEGHRVVPVANRLMPKFPLVVATKDWHPPDHVSFASRHRGRHIGDVIEVDGESQTLWPDHCVIDTPGADFASGLDRQTFHAVFHKGTGRNADTYSGFFDDRRHKPTGLAGFLRERGVKDVFVMGLATEYCVKYTVLDALAEGFHVHVIADGCRAVELRAGDAAAALEEMRRAGATVLDSDEI